MANIVKGKMAILSKKLKEKDGGDYVNTGVKILMGVVIGALLLAGLYTLFKDNVLVTLTTKITEMFNYGD